MSVRTIFMAVVMFCTIGLSSTVSASDETSKTGGMLSLTRVTPDVTPFSDYSGDFLNRSTMTGDWGGLRTDLYEKGKIGRASCRERV